MLVNCKPFTFITHERGDFFFFQHNDKVATIFHLLVLYIRKFAIYSRRYSLCEVYVYVCVVREEKNYDLLCERCETLWTEYTHAFARKLSSFCVHQTTTCVCVCIIYQWRVQIFAVVIDVTFQLFLVIAVRFLYSSSYVVVYNLYTRIFFYIWPVWSH